MVVWAPNFFGQTKFEVKILLEFILLPSTLNWIFQDGSRPTFFGNAKFEVKNFSEFFHLQSTVDTEFLAGGLDTNSFWSCKIWGQKFFRNFSFTEHCGLWIIRSGGQGTNIFGHTKFEVKNVLEFSPLPSTVDTKFFRGMSWPTLFGHVKFETKQIFRIPSLTEHCRLWIFRRGVRALTFFSHTKFAVKNFLEFFSLASALDWIFQDGSGPTFFSHSKFETKKF